jgi:peptide deformylase
MFTILEDTQTPDLKEMDNAPEFIKENKELLQNFYAFAKGNPKTAGLASNQVGLTDRFIMVKTKKEGWILAVDPQIIGRYGNLKRKVEGCLSWPNKDIVANRYEKVTVAYHDIKGNAKKRVISTDDFEAQIWQHEINHLNGIVETVVKRVEPITNQDPKVGRNDPCHCGSGKKFKKCHG